MTSLQIARLTCWVLASLALASCGSGDSPQPKPPSGSPPQQPPVSDPDPNFLTLDELTSSQPPQLHGMSAFSASIDAGPANVPFAGTLTLAESDIISDLDFALERSIHPGYSPTRSPPATFSLVSDGEALIPVDRGLISAWPNSGSYWDLILGAGKVWSEPNDNGWSRGALPVTLVSRKEGQARNCAATFLYNAASVSDVFVQCSQENSGDEAFAPGEMRAFVATSYEAGQPEQFADDIAQFREEMAQRFEVRDWDDLPVSDSSSLLAIFNEAAAPGSRSLSALMLDRILYREPPVTRRGTYPFPDEMRHGVHSIAKSLAGSLAMFHLAQRYGDDIFDIYVTDIIPEALAFPGWQGVTFEHLLNMATGTAGEDAGNSSFAFRPDSTHEILQFVGQLGDAPPLPGEEFSYATTHTIVLSIAMQRLVEDQEGPGVYYWDLIQRDVLDKIGVYNLPMQTSLEPNGTKGLPTLGVGAFPNADEIAKIVQLYLDEGNHEGVQLLSRTRLRDAINRTDWQGYKIGEFSSYKHSFWQFSVTSSSLGCTYQVSAMQGFGGNHVVIMPNGIVGIRLKDDDQYSISPILRAASEIAPAC